MPNTDVILPDPPPVTDSDALTPVSSHLRGVLADLRLHVAIVRAAGPLTPSRLRALNIVRAMILLLEEDMAEELRSANERESEQHRETLRARNEHHGLLARAQRVGEEIRQVLGDRSAPISPAVEAEAVAAEAPEPEPAAPVHASSPAPVRVSSPEHAVAVMMQSAARDSIVMPPEQAVVIQAALDAAHRLASRARRSYARKPIRRRGMQFGRWLRRVRLQARLTQADLGLLVGTTSRAVAGVESGQHSPYRVTIRKYAAVFGDRAMADALHSCSPPERAEQ